MKRKLNEYKNTVAIYTSVVNCEGSQFKKIQNSLKLTFLKLWSHSETAVSETSSVAIVSSDIDPSEIEGQSNGVLEI